MFVVFKKKTVHMTYVIPRKDQLWILGINKIRAIWGRALMTNKIGSNSAFWICRNKRIVWLQYDFKNPEDYAILSLKILFASSLPLY